MSVLGTREVAKILGVSHSRLIRAVWDGRVSPPSKMPGGAFGWTDEDINRASWVLLHKAYEPRRSNNNK
jgi:predicted DNA-binding transcriptional regulator AlpA